MAKKKYTQGGYKKTGTKPGSNKAKAPKREYGKPYQNVTFKTSVKQADWIRKEADQLGMSRNQYIITMFDTLKEAQETFGVEGKLFNTLRTRMEDVLENAIVARLKKRGDL